VDEGEAVDVVFLDLAKAFDKVPLQRLIKKLKTHGRPRDGAIADIMRRTRAAYHYAVRYIKQNNSDIVKQRFASATVEIRSRDFWREVKEVRGGTGDIQRTVDGHTQNDFIADLFANKYKDTAR